MDAVGWMLRGGGLDQLAPSHAPPRTQGTPHAPPPARKHWSPSTSSGQVEVMYRVQSRGHYRSPIVWNDALPLTLTLKSRCPAPLKSRCPAHPKPIPHDATLSSSEVDAQPIPHDATLSCSDLDAQPIPHDGAHHDVHGSTYDEGGALVLGRLLQVDEHKLFGKQRERPRGLDAKGGAQSEHQVGPVGAQRVRIGNAKHEAGVGRGGNAVGTHRKQ